MSPLEVCIMSRPRSEIRVVCQNDKCSYYLKKKGKNIIKRGKYPTGHQRYYCYHCGTFFHGNEGDAPLQKTHVRRQNNRDMQASRGKERDTFNRTDHGPPQEHDRAVVGGQEGAREQGERVFHPQSLLGSKWSWAKCGHFKNAPLFLIATEL